MWLIFHVDSYPDRYSTFGEGHSISIGNHVDIVIVADTSEWLSSIHFSHDRRTLALD